MKDHFIPVRDHKPTTKKTMYSLIVEEYVPVLDPPKSFSFVSSFDPNGYFITSGDAIWKAQKLSKDLWQYAGRVRSALNSAKTKCKNMQAFEKRCWKSAGGATALINALITARGEAIFMETEWRNHLLICIPKNPKLRPPNIKK